MASTDQQQPTSTGHHRSSGQHHRPIGRSTTGQPPSTSSTTVNWPTGPVNIIIIIIITIGQPTGQPVITDHRSTSTDRHHRSIPTSSTEYIIGITRSTSPSPTSTTGTTSSTITGHRSTNNNEYNNVNVNDHRLASYRQNTEYRHTVNITTNTIIIYRHRHRPPSDVIWPSSPSSLATANIPSTVIQRHPTSRQPSSQHHHQQQYHRHQYRQSSVTVIYQYHVRHHQQYHVIQYHRRIVIIVIVIRCHQ